MELANEHVAALQDFSYTEPEARFLYLVATHSGYFTADQYIDFRRQPMGWYISEPTRKIIEKNHGRVTVCARNTYLFNVYSRNLCGVIGKENSRNRRQHSVELIRRRLHILDFLIANPDFHYLEAETDKVRYFHETLALPRPVLPWRIYRGLKANAKRYFVRSQNFSGGCGSMANRIDGANRRYAPNPKGAVPAAPGVTYDTLTFARSEGNDFDILLTFPGPRGPMYPLGGYPVISEFRAMLSASDAGSSISRWNGEHFFGYLVQREEEREFWFRAHKNGITFGFSEQEWSAVRELFRRAWELPELRAAWDALSLEYGEL